MVKILGTIVLILSLLLFPPAALALVSNNAVPGDVTYPIKIKLEDVIFAIASVNPVSKAWFAAARSDRRFSETTHLIAAGKSATTSLNDLVAQSVLTAEEIKKVEDPVKKQELIAQFSESLTKYDQGLKEVSVPSPSYSNSIVTPTPTQVLQQPNIPSVSPTQAPITVRPTATQAPIKIQPTATPSARTSTPSLSPSPTIVQPTATIKIEPTHSPTPIVIQPPAQNNPSPTQQKEIDKAISDINKINDDLKKERHINVNKSEERKPEIKKPNN